MKRIWRKMNSYPFISITLVFINCIVFILCQFMGGRLYAEGHLGIRGVVENREYGRFVWSMFLHSDLEHLINNMILLFFLGSMLEKVIGHVSYAVLYFASGIGGGVLSLAGKIVHNDFVGSIGASGAVFGLDGLLLAVVILLRYKIPEITPLRVGLMIGLSLYSGYAGSNIDNFAHIGGLLVGWLVGIVICATIRYKDSKNRLGIVQTRGV